MAVIVSPTGARKLALTQRRHMAVASNWSARDRRTRREVQRPPADTPRHTSTLSNSRGTSTSVQPFAFVRRQRALLASGAA
jgi:hypothetical protein